MPPNQFSAFFSERVGYKSGLALTREELIEHLGHTDPIAPAIASKSDIPLPLRTDEIEDAFQLVLHKLGRLPQPFVGHGPTLIDLKYRCDLELHTLFESVLSLLGNIHFDKGKQTLSDGFDKSAFFKLVNEKLPSKALQIAEELVELIEVSEQASPWPWHEARQIEWTNSVDLQNLFASESLETPYGTFFDQRFVDYLAANFDKLSSIHWRQFEGLTAEYFKREGLNVDIGTGRNDGGIDIRVWHSELPAGAPPTMLIQCKRQKQKVEKVVVKALWADVVDEGATSGLIVTSSTLSPGAETVRRARSYPVNVADREMLKRWIERLRTPGRGVFLGS